jgi:hypothetical protein
LTAGDLPASPSRFILQVVRYYRLWHRHSGGVLLDGSTAARASARQPGASARLGSHPAAAAGVADRADPSPKSL